MNNDEINIKNGWIYLFTAWIVAIFSMLGSLFFSEIMEFIPCSLCWYQRILMYPLVIILLVSMFPYDLKVLKYAAPFVVLGILFSFYHNLINIGIIPESASPCVQGVPCSTKYIEWFGFISIPMLSFVAFTLIALLLYKTRKVSI